MSSKYKLLRDLPNVDAGAVFEKSYFGDYFVTDNYENTYTVDECVISEQIDWFSPYLFTSKDYKDIFKGDYVCIVTSSDTIKEVYNYKSLQQDEHCLYFSTKEKAQEYLDSLKPKFKVGDIVVSENNIYDKVFIGELIELTPVMLLDADGTANSFILKDITRKATEQEIISYYEQQGWVKGAKFKDKNNNIMIFDSFVIDNEVCVFDKNKHIRYFKDCELIKEPVYPKSLEDIKSHILETNYSSDFCRNIITANKEQYDSLLAFSLLTVLHKAMIDEYNKFNGCDWKPDWRTKEHKHFIVRKYEYLTPISTSKHYSSLAFPNKELAEFALKEWNNLWKQYFEL